MSTPVQSFSFPLIRVRGIPHAAEYYRTGRPGARRELYLHHATDTRLRVAQARLKQLSTTTRKYGLLVWDGYRSREVQQGIFHEYVAHLMNEHGLHLAEAQNAALTYVSDPDSVFPHGTGGTVDLTLTINGDAAEMGTGFDDFSERSHRDWFLTNPPADEESWEAHRNRVLLHHAMTGAGFVGLHDEWWHFEWGTARWAITTGREPVLTTTLVYPIFEEEPAA